MSVLVLLAGLPWPVLLTLVISILLCLFWLLFLVAFVPAASERIIRFVDILLRSYYRARNLHSRHHSRRHR